MIAKGDDGGRLAVAYGTALMFPTLLGGGQPNGASESGVEQGKGGPNERFLCALQRALRKDLRDRLTRERGC